MNLDEASGRIAKIGQELLGYERLVSLRVSSLEEDAEDLIRAFAGETENEVAGQVLTLTPYVARVYLDAEYHLSCALFYASPSLFAFLSAVWGVIVFVYEAVKTIIDIFHIKELLVIADILSVIWPEFRKRMNAIYGKISEFSATIGWGADGIMHLLQSTQQGISTLGGLLGKDDSWLEIKGADRAIDAVRRLSDNAHAIARDPGGVLDIVFKAESRWSKFETNEWWTKTFSRIHATAALASSTIIKVSGIIDDMQDLENRLPEFVRKNIPEAIWAGLDWADARIEGTLLPALARFDRTFNEVNAVLEAHRQKAASLVDQLTRPGDVLLGVDKLTEAGRLAQEDKIDDATSRKYERDTDKYELEDAGTIKEFERVAIALKVPFPPPAFLAIEDLPAREIPGIVLEDKETWFVGDF